MEISRRSFIVNVQDTFPQIITDFGRLSNPEYSIEDKWYFQGEYCLLWIVLLILVPLGEFNFHFFIT